jgi:leucyl-tRNA synthetase
VHVAAWPEPRASSDDGEIELVVQVDGRVRDRVTVAAGLVEADAVAAALSRPKVSLALDGRTVARAVHVPDRLVNLVTTG